MVGRAEWLSGQLSVSAIGRRYGPSSKAITAKARREKWPSWDVLVGKDRSRIESQLLEDETVPAGVPPSEPVGLIESETP